MPKKCVTEKCKATFKMRSFEVMKPLRTSFRDKLSSRLVSVGVFKSVLRVEVRPKEPFPRFS